MTFHLGGWDLNRSVLPARLNSFRFCNRAFDQGENFGKIRHKTKNQYSFHTSERHMCCLSCSCNLYSKQLDLEKVRICGSIEHLISRVWSVGCDFPFEIAKLYSWQAYDWNVNQGKKARLPESRVSMFATLAPEFKSYNSNSVCVDSHLASHPCDGHVNGKVPEHFFSQKNWDEAG